MTQHDWSSGAHALGLFLNGEGITAPGPEGERVEDDSFLLLFNASPRRRARSRCRAAASARRWSLVLDTADPDADAGSRDRGARRRADVTARSLVLLRRVD